MLLAHLHLYSKRFALHTHLALHARFIQHTRFARNTYALCLDRSNRFQKSSTSDGQRQLLLLDLKMQGCSRRNLKTVFWT